MASATKTEQGRSADILVRLGAPARLGSGQFGVSPPGPDGGG